MSGSNFTLTSLGASIVVDLHDNEITAETLIGQVRRYVPGLTTTTTSKADHNFVIRKGTNRFEFSGSHSLYQAEELIVDDAVAIISRVFEYLYWQQGAFSVHASSIAIGSKAILITGRPRCGKSTIAVKLSKKKNFELLSTDRCIVKNGHVIAGTKYPLTVCTHTNVTETYQPKRVVDIVYPIIEPIELNVKRLDHVKAFYMLSHQVFYFLEEFPKVIYSTRQVIPDLVTWEEKNRLLFELSAFLVEVPSFQLIGELEDKCEWIEKELTNATHIL